MNTLRARFLLSHVLPLLIAIPLMGLALIYLLETRVVLPDLTRELLGEAHALADIASGRPDLWREPAQAQAFADRFGGHLEARVMLIDGEGRLLASTDPADRDRIMQPLDQSLLAAALAGEETTRQSYSRSQEMEVVDILTPVLDANGDVRGVIRLSHQLVNVLAGLARLRIFIAGVLGGGLLLGAIVGLLLALSLEQPLRRLSADIGQLARGEVADRPLPAAGPEELRLLVQSFNSLNERLHSLEQARRQLLANLVHELGRPLGAVNAALDVMIDVPDLEAGVRSELLAGMHQEILHLRRLLDDLAGMYDQVLGVMELAKQPLAPSAWLKVVLAPWRQAAQAAGLSWRSEIPPDLPAVQADPDRLGQIVGNLLSNAIKYTAAGGQVAVEAGADEEGVWVRVSDSGPGISEQEQEAIFTPFYRVQSSSRFSKGMGLGLNIARSLAEAHGGYLTVQSQMGEGSQFTVWLPRAERGVAIA